MDELPMPPVVPADWLRIARDPRPACGNDRGVGHDRELGCNLARGHPGDWHLEADRWSPPIWWQEYKS